MLYLYEDALVITTEIANSLIHRLLVDSGITVNILYWGAYQKTGLRRVYLTPTTSFLYGFTGDSVIPEGTIKQVVTQWESPQTATVVINFLAVNCPLSFNQVLGRPLLRALKVVMSIHCLTMKFPTVARICQVRGRQRDSKEYYSRSLKLAKKGP